MFVSRVASRVLYTMILRRTKEEGRMKGTYRRAGAGLARGLDAALEHVGGRADGGGHGPGDEAG